MAPPGWSETVAKPCVRIKPEIETVAPALSTKICCDPPPLIVIPLYVVEAWRSPERRALALTPGPAIETRLVIVIGLDNVIVEPAGSVNKIVSPALALPTAYRSEPGPLSAVVLATGPSVIAS